MASVAELPRRAMAQQQAGRFAELAEFQEQPQLQVQLLDGAAKSPSNDNVHSFYYSMPDRHYAWDLSSQQHWLQGDVPGTSDGFGYQVLMKNGTLFNLNTSGNREQDVKVVQQLIEQGAVLSPQLRPDETGYWNPAVQTNEQGLATVTITLPNRSTAWTLAAKGITADTLAGEAKESLKCQKDLFGQLKTPAAFTDKDRR